jgi:formylglycine-generating enzyme required for sulfatase activity
VKILSPILMLLFILPFSTELNANDINVKNVRLTGQVSGSHTFVNFDLSWENSWRNSTNWDAAWLFVKYKVGTGEWQHATLSATPTDHTAPTGSTISPASDGKGVFIHRSSNGTGDNNFADVSLRWNYPTDLVANDAQLTVKVFAIEMVYIPQGNFFVGDSVSAKRFHPVGDTLAAFQITSEDVLIIDGTTPGSLWAKADLATGNIPAGFPKGYQAFYVMKYEITQGQYTEFLNLLTSTQAATRIDTAEMKGDRFTIIGGYPLFTTNRPSRACNYLKYEDGAAYADWAGLRPISELEFEKAARGTAPVVAGEYAWGDTIIDLTGGLSGIEDGTETVTDGLNVNHGNFVDLSGGDGGKGPIRVGIFSATTNTRNGSGGSFYGVMELSGNVWETVITCGLVASRIFDGASGDGNLNTAGDADVTGWPTNALGGRGGGWQNDQSHLRVSDRFYINFAALREPGNGFRCGRTAE